MAMTEAKRSMAHAILRVKNEPLLQKAIANALLETVRRMFDERNSNGGNTISMSQYALDNLVNDWKQQPPQCSHPYFGDFNLKLDMDGRLMLNEKINSLLAGRAQVELFNPSPEELERLWAEHQAAKQPTKASQWVLYCEKLRELAELAGAAQVSFSIHFNEGAGTWWIAIESSAPSENCITKDYGDMENALDMAIAHLKPLQPE